MSFSNGVARLILWAAATISTIRRRYVEPEPGPSAPSSSGLDQSMMILAGSKSYLLPKPWHSGQAPYTLLKENDRGSSAGMLMPQSGQATRAEQSYSSAPTTASCTRP